MGAEAQSGETKKFLSGQNFLAPAISSIQITPSVCLSVCLDGWTLGIDRV